LEIFASSSDFGVDSQAAIDGLLGPLNLKLVRHGSRGPMKESDLLALPAHYQALINFSSHDVFSARVMDHFPGLKIIARHGVGYDSIDVRAATERGIYVTNTRQGAGEDRAVSDLTIAMLLALSRNLIPLAAATKAGGWERPLSGDLDGKTLGIVGLGKIGKMTATKARAFGMNVLACDVVQDERFAAEHQISYVSFDELIAASDFISLHCPMSAENQGIIGAREFARMKNGAVFINCARGQLVDEAALYEAAKSGKLSGVGVDVYCEEPPKNNPLLSLPNVIATPHIAAYTKATMTGMDMLVVSACADALRGKQPENLVNEMASRTSAAPPA
jgi:D-3-phosphoglycerate dehydrogenase